MVHLDQASGTVRFLHHKHQCYIAGKGSFVGHYGELPEAQGSDQEILASIKHSTTKRCSVSPFISYSQSQGIEVEADVEPNHKDASLPGSSPPLRQQQKEHLETLPDLPDSMLEDEVVSEEGYRVTAITYYLVYTFCMQFTFVRRKLAKPQLPLTHFGRLRNAIIHTVVQQHL